MAEMEQWRKGAENPAELVLARNGADGLSSTLWGFGGHRRPFISSSLDLIRVAWLTAPRLTDLGEACGRGGAARLAFLRHSKIGGSSLQSCRLEKEAMRPPTKRIPSFACRVTGALCRMACSPMGMGNEGGGWVSPSFAGLRLFDQ